MDVTHDNARPFTGRKMLLSVVAFFGVIIAVNMVLLTFALENDNGLVAKNGYVASQNFNTMMAEARAQEKLGWRATVDYSPGVVEMRYADASGAPLGGLDIAGRVGRPVTNHDDREVAFVETESGLYRMQTELGAGAWEIDVTARDGAGNAFRRIMRFTVKD